MHSPRPRSPLHSPNLGVPQNGLGLGLPLSGGGSSSGSSSGGRRKSGLRARSTQLLALRFGWVVLVIWYEVGEFFSSLSSCKFPDSQLRLSPKSGSSYSRWSKAPVVQPTHIVLLADPHVPHPKLSYAEGSRSWINRLRTGLDELFMRKSWNVVMRLGRVDGVVMLGDMLDWGRGNMPDEEYEAYYNRFTSIFQLPESTPIYYVPGNHDIPIGPNNHLFSSDARQRYADHFSPPNAILEVANHSLILLDAVGLVEEDYRRYASEMQFGEWDGVEGGVIEFIKALGEDPPPGPKILLSHIPLARPDAATCGPHRESGRIHKGAGIGYQNLLGSETSRFILDVIKPIIIFSGDDHDYCDFQHPNGPREITLKSFSSSTGIRRPGFQLLSLIPPTTGVPYGQQRTIADRPCFLPDQAGVYYSVYIPMAVLTILFLFGTNVRQAWLRWKANGGSIYADLKSRLSPNLPSEEFPTPSLPAGAATAGGGGGRRFSDRPVPITLPSRKSSQHLMGLSVLTPTSTTSFAPRPTRLGSAFDPRSTSFSSRSAPVSPSASPRIGYVDDTREKEDDFENAIAETPNVSRRSSAIYMKENGYGYPGLGGIAEQGRGDPYQTPVGGAGLVSTEPSSYFLPLPDGPGPTQSLNSPGIMVQAGLGLSTPSGSFPAVSTGLRRASSSFGYGSSSASVSPNPASQSYHSLSQQQQQQQSQPQLQSQYATMGRRVTMPKMLTASASDWSAAAKAKEKSIFGVMVDSLPIPGGGTVGSSRRKGGGVGAGGGWPGLDVILGFSKWLWRARNGVLGRSWKEVWMVAYPAAICWVIVNALFFLG